ncbi:MAG: hypothetical protein ABIV26_04645, partial [Candidatus Limnocylindrales bacterium]
AETEAPTMALPAETDLRTTTALAIDAGPSPDFIVIAGDAAFVSGVGDGVGWFDAATGDALGSVSIPGDSCEALDSGFGAAWTATCAGAGLARIDALTGAVSTVTLDGQIPDPEASIGAGEGAVWLVVRGTPRILVRVDPVTMAVTGRFPVPGSSSAVRAGLGGVWVSDPEAGVVHRIDPATGVVVADIRVGTRPQFLAVGEGAVWTMNQADGTISRIDPSSNAVTATIELGEPVQGGDIATGGGFLWLRGSQTLLFKIDPVTNKIVARYGPSAGSGSVAADDRAVWITAHDILRIWRLEPDGIIE